MVPPNASAIFDDIVMTDQPTSGESAQCFSDDFEDGNTLGWTQFQSDADVNVAGGVLEVTTDTTELMYYTTVSLENFVVRVTTSHRSGNKKISVWTVSQRGS